MIRADYHMHTHHSGDSEADMHKMLDRCISLGFTNMSFTEHYDPDYVYQYDCTPGLFELNTSAYREEFESLFTDALQVNFGVELGVQPHIVDQLSNYVNQNPFDFVIASSHLCHRKDPYYSEFFEGRSTIDAYREYFQSIDEMVHSFQDFNVYGHLDYVIRYSTDKDNHYQISDYIDYIDSILSTLIQNGKGIEINTGGLRNGLKSTNPCSDIIRRYRELGGEIITVGSDAHKPEDVGYQFDIAEQILIDSGFRYYTTFRSRVPSFHKLG